MMKKILLLLTLLLVTTGGSKLWADRYVITWHDGNAHQYVNAQETGTFFDWDSGKHNINTKFVDANDKPEYTDNSIGTITFSTGLKLESNTKNMDDATRVSFTVTNSSTLTILKSTYYGGDRNIILYNNSTNTLVGTYDGTDSGEGYKEIRVQGLPAGSYSIMRGDGEAGLLYVRVSDDALAMNVRYNDIMLGNYNSSPRINVTNEFAYVAPNTYGSNQGATYLRVCLKGTSAFTNDDYFSVESSNTSVLLVDDDATSKNYLKSGDNTQAYLFVKVTGYSADPVTLTFNYNNGSDVSSCTGTFTVNPGTMTPYNSYPYKWDFQNNEWTSTRLQLDNSTMGGAWTKTSANAVIKQDINTSVVSDINMIKTLAFEAVNEGLTLDWTNKKVSLVAGSKIRIPGDLSGRIVTFDASGEFAWDSEGTVTKMAANKFYVSSGTGVIFSNANAVDIYSIDVSETGVATYETTSAGVFQFTGNGTLAGGTVIRDVPGIEMTIGNGGSWTVSDITDSNVTLKCATYNTSSSQDAILVFRPIVNGYLTLKGKFFAANTTGGKLYLNGSDNSSYVVLDNTTHYISQGDLVIPTPLKAGVTYILTNGTHYNNSIHGFSYEPAFLNTTKTGRQSAENPAVFDAKGSTTVFPSILTDANEYVTFAASSGGAITVDANGNGTPTLVTPTSTAYTITATIASPNSNVTSKTASYQLIYTATAVTLSFNWASPCNTNYVENGTYKNDVTARAGETDVTNQMETWTYTSSDPSIATVASDGTVTILNSGMIEITVTATDTQGTYQSATASYWLTINPTTDVILTLSQGEGDHEFTFGNNYINPGSINVEGPTITYESDNTAVASVNSSGTVIGVKPSENWVTITVCSSQYKQYRPASRSYRVKVKKGTLTMQFIPESIILNPNEYITPFINMTNVYTSTIEGKISVTTSNPSVAVLQTPNAYELVQKGEAPNYMLDRLKVKITGATTEQESDQTATVTVSVTGSEYFNDISTSCNVTVRAKAQQNFSWADGSSIPEYTIYQGDFMLIPAIKGNCSQNDDYSLMSNNKYPKKIKANQTIDKNMEKDYRPGEGVPNYMIVNAESGDGAPAPDTAASNDYAYVIFAQSEKDRSSDFPDSLMVYAKIDDGTADHVVYLRAVDSHNSSYYCDAKITIKPKKSLDSAFSGDVSEMSFPFTWDFTKFSSDDLALIAADKVYYEHRNKLNSSYSGYYLGTGYMNSKNSLAPGDNKTSSVMKSSDLYFQNMVVRTDKPAIG